MNAINALFDHETVLLINQIFLTLASNKPVLVYASGGWTELDIQARTRNKSDTKHQQLLDVPLISELGKLINYGFIDAI